MQNIQLTKEQVKLLKLKVQQHLQEVLVEIKNADNESDKKDLQKELEIFESILKELEK